MKASFLITPFYGVVLACATMPKLLPAQPVCVYGEEIGEEIFPKRGRLNSVRYLVCDTNADDNVDWIDVEYRIATPDGSIVVNTNCHSGIYLRYNDPEPGCRLPDPIWIQAKELYRLRTKLK